MIEATNIYADRRIPVRRNGSFSTAESMTSAADMIHSNKDFANVCLQKKPISLANISTNVKFHNSESIHVGNIVYHIHHHARKRNDNNDSDSIRSDSFGSLTIETIQTFDDLTNRKKSKFRFRVIGAVISIILMLISAIVAFYFVLRDNHKGMLLIDFCNMFLDILNVKFNLVPDFFPTTAEYTTVSIKPSVTETDPTEGSTTTFAYTTTTESHFNFRIERKPFFVLFCFFQLHL